jgi:hypothetical protein
MTETDPGKLADHLEDEADDLEQRSRKLGEQTDDAAQDWERKRVAPNVPGAPPPSGHDEVQDKPTPTGAPTDKGGDG